MSINNSSSTVIARTALVGACFLIGAGALVACGEGTNDVATASAATPAAAYVSPEHTDRHQALIIQHAAYVRGDRLDQRAVPSTSAWTSAEAFEQSGVDSPSAQASVDALERLTFRDDER
jgi:hypothetical protein